MPLKITPSMAKTALPALSFTPSMKSKSRIAKPKSASSTSGRIRKKSWRNAAVSMRLALLRRACGRICCEGGGRRGNHRAWSRGDPLCSFGGIGLASISLASSSLTGRRDGRLFSVALRGRRVVIARIHLLHDLPHRNVQNAEERLGINADPEGQQHQRHEGCVFP